MLKLKKLSFKGIGRFVETQTIDFEQYSNLVQVDGNNCNTGGSSGSGKTTVFNALDYVLGLNDVPVSVLQSRLTKDGISVSSVFDWDGKSLTISRSKSRGLVVEIYDSVISGSKSAEEKLDEILGIPRHLFRPLLHKRQKEGGFFLTMSPKEVNEFLIDCLDLSFLRIKSDVVQNEITDLVHKEGELTNSFEAQSKAIEATKQALESLGPCPEQTVNFEDIIMAKQLIDYTTLELAKQEKLFEEERATLELKRPKVAVIPCSSNVADIESELAATKKFITDTKIKETQRQNQASKQLMALRLTKADLEKVISAGELAGHNAAKIAIDVKQLRAQKCPTCEQSWITDAVKNKENELLDQLKKAKESIVNSRLAQESLKSLELELKKTMQEMLPKQPEGQEEAQAKEIVLTKALLEEREKEKQHLASEMARNNNLLEQFKKEQETLTEKYRPIILELRNSLNESKRTCEFLSQNYSSCEQAIKRYASSVNNLKEQYQKYLDKAATINTELLKIRENLELAKETQKILKSYISCSFDDALEFIGDSSTKMVRNIPNMSNATITLEATRETGTGKIKEEVNVVLNNDGEENVPIKSLSGGERTSIDIAVDLAVLDLIETRTGKTLNLFILDEPFSGMDSQNVEMVLTMLKEINKNKRLFIVDHNEIIKQFCDNKIMVVREGQTSKILENTG